MSNAEKRKALYAKYAETIAFVSENNPENGQPVDISVAFDMMKANAEAEPENRLYKMPGTWTEADYEELKKDCEGLE